MNIMQWIHFKAGWSREGKTKSRVRVDVSLHPCLKARLGGLSLVGLVVTVVSDQTDAEAGNGNTLMRHHPR